MVSVEKVQALNKAIERINAKRTQEEVRLGLLKKQLEEDLAKYKSQYGKDLQGSSLKAIRQNVNAELEAVSTKLQAEYDLKVKVVQAIETGDFQTAYNLLGVEDPNAEVEEEQVSVAMTPVSEDELQGLDDYSDDEEVEYEDEEGVYVEDNEFDEGEEYEEESVEYEESEEEDLEVTDEELSAGASMFLNSVKSATQAGQASVSNPNKATKVKGTSVEAAVKSVDNPLVLPEDDEDEDASDLEDEDFGFGDIISGSRFMG